MVLFCVLYLDGKVQNLIALEMHLLQSFSAEELQLY